ncbi:unnamed protein product [Nesidiocoris tenuis]|uniref:Uncharacterized protein n=1 Tax=Nesidiocoris tenuis TaxID=355587 RepID=A0A6H5HMW7_9HEMI|nr:unnamed protein product [Nesidiocoris tenuis]
MWRFFILGRRRRADVTATAAASRSTSGTACWPTTPTTTARASSWIGSFSHLAAFAGAIQKQSGGRGPPRRRSAMPNRRRPTQTNDIAANARQANITDSDV